MRDTARPDERVARICELIDQHVRAPEGASAPHEDELDRALDGVKSLVEELVALRSSSSVTSAEADARLNELMGVVLALVGFDYTTRATVSDKDDIFDGMAVGLNILAEELATSTVTKAYVNDIIECMSDSLMVTQRDGEIKTTNHATCELTGYSQAEIVGQPLSWFFPRVTIDELLRTGGAWDQEWECRRRAGGPVVVSFSASTMRTRKGDVTGLVCVARDLTASKRMEEERWRLREAVQRQSILLEELSVPIIPVTDRILVLPLIGSLDEGRAARMLEALLQNVVSRRARVAIIDITGARAVDMQASEGVIRIVRAVRLIGAEVVLTGIRPDVATTLVGLGIDLGGVATFGTLQNGMEYALGRARASKAR